MSGPDIPAGDLPASILLQAPGFGDGGVDACVDLVVAAEPSNVLFVSYGGDPSERLARCRERGLDPEATMAVVVGDVGGGVDGFDAVETLSAPSDLTGLGIAVTEALADVEGRTAVCLDSVTALLQYVDFETAFEFLHVFVGRCYRQEAVGHLHVDPGAHDEQTVAKLASLVDGRVVVAEDGSVDSRSASIRDWEE